MLRDPPALHVHRQDVVLRGGACDHGRLPRRQRLPLPPLNHHLLVGLLGDQRVDGVGLASEEGLDRLVNPVHLLDRQRVEGVVGDVGGMVVAERGGGGGGGGFAEEAVLGGAPRGVGGALEEVGLVGAGGEGYDGQEHDGDDGGDEEETAEEAFAVHFFYVGRGCVFVWMVVCFIYL